MYDHKERSTSQSTTPLSLCRLLARSLKIVGSFSAAVTPSKTGQTLARIYTSTWT